MNATRAHEGSRGGCGPRTTRSARRHLVRMLLAGIVFTVSRVLPVQTEAVHVPAGERDRIAALLGEVRFVAYTPREFAVVNGQPRAATEAGIRRDLALLREHFDGLVTYSVTYGLEHVPEIAQALGFRALILGVWDPGNADELATAVRLARAYPKLVAAVAVGNEGLYWKRYGWPILEKALGEIRRELPTTAVTTSEPFAAYLDETYPHFVELQDFLLPNVHPVFETWFRPEGYAQAVELVQNVVKLLRDRYGKPVLVKETGMPSAPASKGYTEALQAQFWRLLLARLPPRTGRAFAWFEAFDGPWKPAAGARESGRLAEEEAHWGLYTAAGKPKAVVEILGPKP
jgi:exo-beta-1,3-glucanase (GH17 family)